MKTVWILTYEIPYEAGGIWCVFENKPTIEELEKAFKEEKYPPDLQRLLNEQTCADGCCYFNLSEVELGKRID